MQQPLFLTKELTSKTFISLNKKKKSSKKEEKIQLALSKYARTKYPDIIFQVDIASGMKLTQGQAVKAKDMRSERGQPDFMVFETRGGFSALLIELKNEVSDVYLKDGVTISDAKSSDHVREQDAILKRLRAKGFMAVFGFGLSHCIEILDSYMKL